MRTGAFRTILLLAAGVATAQTDSVKTQPDPNKRAELAVDQADRDLGVAREDWRNGDWNAALSALDEVKQSAELANTSLGETTQPPRNNRHYKNVEVKFSNLIRKVDAFRLEVDYEQREAVNRIETRLQELHEHILDAVMTKRRTR